MRRAATVELYARSAATTIQALQGNRKQRWHDDSELLWLDVVGVPLDDWMAADTLFKFRVLMAKRRLGVWVNYIRSELFKQGTATYWIGSEW